MSTGDVVGIVANGALPYEFDAITREAVPVGDYVVVRTADGSEVLGPGRNSWFSTLGFTGGRSLIYNWSRRSGSPGR